MSSEDIYLVVGERQEFEIGNGWLGAGLGVDEGSVVPLISDWERPFTKGWTQVWEHPRIV